MAADLGVDHAAHDDRAVAAVLSVWSQAALATTRACSLLAAIPLASSNLARVSTSWDVLQARLTPRENEIIRAMSGPLHRAWATWLGRLARHRAKLFLRTALGWRPRL